ncbi:GNAT family N-acetyltransferase [Paenibacillus sacheonensis]|uniref:GNAT family N-acetyltransferase n=1 Tax=Paenibacillus sacheonensis TaxID=742054 RepID=A0A7X4YMV2_9BACL|nr:GNAT family N-acetyltransferase [Paenibacillus sacheonensis]NBC69281.1 GNAT family N-acetyltransferase [Paenibacillus sacheonensis]
MFSQRALRDDDLETIASFPQSADELFYMGPRFVYPLTAEQIVRKLEDRHAPTVVVDESTESVAGYANLYDCSEEQCWLGNVVVAPEYRGTGAADRLIETMKQNARTRFGARRLVLSCHQTNARGLAFYHKRGFKPYDLKIIPFEGRGMVITIQMGIDL